MAKQLFGITNRNNEWMFYPDGKLMAFDDARLAKASIQRVKQELPGGPFEVKEIGSDGFPADLMDEIVDPKAKK